MVNALILLKFSMWGAKKYISFFAPKLVKFIYIFLITRAKVQADEGLGVMNNQN